MRDLRIYSSILSNGLSRIAIGVLNIVVVPLYMKHLGMEAYGLVGFFTILQNFLIVFDFGISAALTRSLSQHSNDSNRAQDSRNLARTLEIIYWSISIVAGLIIGLISPLIASHWIKRVELSEQQVLLTLWSMAIAIIFQFPVSFYTAGLVGLQKQVEQSILNVVLWTLRCLGVLAVMSASEDKLQAFFVWNIIVSALSAICMREFFWHFIPKAKEKTRFSKVLLSSVWKFALSVSAVTVLLLIFNNSDKFILSGRLDLTHLGYYMAAWQIAAVLYILYMPIYTAYYPVFTQLYAANDSIALKKAFHRASQLMSVLVIPVVMVIMAFTPEILQIWTHKPDVVQNSSPIVRAFMPGALAGAFFYVPWAIEQARGQVHKLVIYPVIGICLLVPVLLILANQYGAVGGAISWMLTNIFLMGGMSVYVLRTSLRGELLNWLIFDIGIPFCSCLLITLLARYFFPSNLASLSALLCLALVWAIAASATAVASPLLLLRNIKTRAYAS